MALIRHFALLAGLYCCFPFLQAASAAPGSVEFFVNAAGSQNQDYGDQTNIPSGFGDGEFTLELWIRPNNNFPVGTVLGGAEQRENWAIDDVAPYSDGNWWFKGNFLLDGHNNGSGFSLGTFSLQFYGGGRVRWLFGDGSSSIPTGSLWSVGAYPASSTPSLLDGNWHQLTLVRRWSGQSSAQLELWIDGSLVDTETSNVRTNMRQWWNSWPGFPSSQEGWFWGAEKQAAVGVLPQYEDYKGLIDEIRFWSRAKSVAEIAADYSNPVTGSEPGLLANYDFREAQGGSVCDSINTGRCIFLRNSPGGVWSPVNAPLSNSSDAQAPSTPAGLQGNAVSATQINLTWNASSDNVGVTGYDVRRNGTLITTTANTSFNDTGLAPNTGYTYTVAARDAAGNVSAASAGVTVTTQATPDTQAPSTPAGLQGNAVSATQINLTWNASSDNVGVTGYDVRRNGTLITTTANTSFNDTGLAPNTSYTYTVAARDAAGNLSLPSAAIVVSATAGAPLSSGSGGGAISIPGLIMLLLGSIFVRAKRTTVSARAHSPKRCPKNGNQIVITPQSCSRCMDRR